MRLVTAAVTTALVIAGVTAPATQAGVVDDVYPQAHGEMIVGLPDTATCTTVIVQDAEFRNSAYGPDRPWRGTYTPTCTGPWSRVVLTLDAKVVGGVQFDRLGDVVIGGAELLHFTTPEGTNGETSWSIDRDVTTYVELLDTPQPVYFQIGNVTDGTYTGIFHGSLKLTFYSASTAYPAPATPDHVWAVTTPNERWISHVTRPSARIATTRVFPHNLTGLKAEVFTSGHGGCEEDWWYDPFICEGSPYREAAVYVDGTLAGIAPIFPAVFTGGWGPDWWRPIPAPRTLNLRPYTVDLTPFVGLLTDDEPHQISVGILNWLDHPGKGDYWPLATNLLLSTNHMSSARTQGGLTTWTTTPDPQVTGPNDYTASSTLTTASHTLFAQGWLKIPKVGMVTTTVDAKLSATVNVIAAAVEGDWNWATGITTATTDRAGVTTTIREDLESTYQMIRTGVTWSFIDAEKRTVQRNGVVNFTSSLDDRMLTHGPTMVTGIYGVSQESWRYQDSEIGCVTHDLGAAMQEILRDEVTTDCPIV